MLVCSFTVNNENHHRPATSVVCGIAPQMASTPWHALSAADALAKLDARKLKPSDAVFLTDKYPPPVPKDAPGARSRAEFFAQLSQGLGCFTRAFAPRLMQHISASMMMMMRGAISPRARR